MRYRNLIFPGILFLLITSCRHYRTSAYFQTDIQTNWEFKKITDSLWIPAKVPGSIAENLMMNGIIQTPIEKNEEKLLDSLLGQSWEYRASFDVSPEILNHDNVYLHLGQVDPPAEIYLNDSLLFTSHSSYLSYDVNCKALLRKKGNMIHLIFPTKTGKNEPAGPSCFRTRVVENGWSAGPALSLKGIHQPVRLIAWSAAHIASIDLIPVEVNREIARYTLKVEIQTTRENDYELSFNIGDAFTQKFNLHLTKGVAVKNFDFNLDHPDLWWCNGLGKPSLYGIRLVLSQDQVPVSTFKQRFGIRKLELVNSPDSTGIPFYFRLNGVPVYCKGAAIVPSYRTLTENPRTYSQQLVAQMVASNMNMVRIWGASAYADDHFYNLCDENGILVWQDIMDHNDPSCSSGLIDEVAENARRLRNHPSLALWCNENESLFLNSDKNTRNPQKTNRTLILRTDSILQRTIDSIAPGNSYYSGLQKNGSRKGFTHSWGVWYNSQPFTDYSTTKARFVNEFGMQSIPDTNSLYVNIPSDSINTCPLAAIPDLMSRIPWIHNKMNSYQRILEYSQMYYNQPVNFSSLVYISQILQSEALKYAIEHQRIQKPYCMGSIYWQMNDSWPCTSWSTIDYNNHWKPAQYAVRNAFNNLIVVPDPKDNHVNLWMVNDSLASVDGILMAEVFDFDGTLKWHSEKKIKAAANSSFVAEILDNDDLCDENNRNKEFLYVKFISGNKKICENYYFFTDPMYLDLPVPDITTTLTAETDNEFVLTLSSNKFAKNVVLSTLNADAEFSDNNFNLLPGKNHQVLVNFSGSKVDLENELSVFSLIDSY